MKKKEISSLNEQEQKTTEIADLVEQVADLVEQVEELVEQTVETPVDSPEILQKRRDKQIIREIYYKLHTQRDELYTNWTNLITNSEQVYIRENYSRITGNDEGCKTCGSPSILLKYLVNLKSTVDTWNV